MSRLALAFASIVVITGCGRKPAKGPQNQMGMLEGGAWTQPEKKVQKTATIVDAGELYSSINQGDCIPWPSAHVKQAGGTSGWGGWYPKNGMSGTVVSSSPHCSNPGLTVYIVDFGDNHYAALNQNGVTISEGGSAPPVAAAAPTVRIVSAGKVYPMINTGDCLTWPDASSKALGGTNGWGGWSPQNGDTGVAIGKSKHCSQSVTVVFVKIGAKVVPIDEKGIAYVTGSTAAVPWAGTPGVAVTTPTPGPVSKVGAGTVDSGRVRLVDVGEVYTSINTTDCLQWPDDETKKLSGSSAWAGWSPKDGDVGVVVWKSAHCNGTTTVLVVRVADKYFVPIGKKGVAPE
ncbi:MAG: hypothetical protein IPJ34_16865 [Myxococcales bacterium]|nr:hypothetical protein [Myxococcales bacterium]